MQWFQHLAVFGDVWWLAFIILVLTDASDKDDVKDRVLGSAYIAAITATLATLTCVAFFGLR